jgi:hypothetical protein
MNKWNLYKIVVLLALGVFCLSGSAFADMSKLIGSLVDQLGVTQEQATGGAGAVFKQAKDNMSASDYTQLLDAVPGIDSLISKAPEAGGLADKATSLIGDSSGSMKGMAALADSFGKLGLAPDMVSKFVPVIMDYVQGAGGEQAMGLLKGALM